jgi:hypothetical protein
MKVYGRPEGQKHAKPHRTLADWEGPPLPAGWNRMTPEQQDAYQERMFEAEFGQRSTPPSSASRGGVGGNGTRAPTPPPSRKQAAGPDWFEEWDRSDAPSSNTAQRIELGIQAAETLTVEAARARRAHEDMNDAIARLEREIRTAW